MHYKTTKKTAFSQHHCSLTKFHRDYSCVQTQIRWWKIKGSEEQFRQVQSVWSGSIILASRWVPHAPTSTYDKLKPQRLLTEHWVSIIAKRETIKRRTAGSFRFLQTSTTVCALLLLESSHPAFQTQKPQKKKQKKQAVYSSLHSSLLNFSLLSFLSSSSAWRPFSF